MPECFQTICRLLCRFARHHRQRASNHRRSRISRSSRLWLCRWQEPKNRDRVSPVFHNRHICMLVVFQSIHRQDHTKSRLLRSTHSRDRKCKLRLTLHVALKSSSCHQWLLALLDTNRRDTAGACPTIPSTRMFYSRFQLACSSHGMYMKLAHQRKFWSRTLVLRHGREAEAGRSRYLRKPFYEISVLLKKPTWILHLQVGAVELHTPFDWHSLVALPTSECSFGHLYSIVAPTVKFLPVTVVLWRISGEPHDNGGCWHTKWR